MSVKVELDENGLVKEGEYFNEDGELALTVENVPMTPGVNLGPIIFPAPIPEPTFFPDVPADTHFEYDINDWYRPKLVSRANDHLYEIDPELTRREAELMPEPIHHEAMRNFQVHKVDDQPTLNWMAMMRRQYAGIAQELLRRLPETREVSLALTKLEEAMFWTSAAAARTNGTPNGYGDTKEEPGDEAK